MKINNIDLEIYQKNVLKNCDRVLHLPSMSSALMKKRGVEFLEMVEANKVVVMTKQYFDTIELQLENTDLTDQQLCYYVMMAFEKERNMPLQTFPTFYGFDTDASPDQTYLQALLFAVRPNDPIFEGRAKKTEVLSHAKQLTIVEMILQNKQVDVTNIFKVEKALKKQIASESVAYGLLRFKLPELHDHLNAVLKLKDQNPNIGLLFERFPPQQLPLLPLQHHQQHAQVPPQQFVNQPQGGCQGGVPPGQ